ncbi:MAG TPA: ArsI/CadI family heavy metal resistance metalloenzyme [Urbifossiella sp.]|nr:ArsI/CadI family heavy metal resistance metalloenzyme [Urbifossiella sp.]
MPLPVIEEPIKFHLSLNVPDLERAVAFYRGFFGIEPAKHHPDYAKFELDEPPVVFSLAPHPPGPGASLSHLGLQVSDDAALEAFRQRLEAAGICTQAQDGTVCGYARQNKLWVKDPFDNFWEVYRIAEHVPPESVRTSLEGPAARSDAECAAAKPHSSASWEYYVGNSIPERIPHDDGSLDEVRLTGLFNANLPLAQVAHLLREAFRALKPGGKLLTHGLMGDRPLPGTQPKLPGLAARVAVVPAHGEVVRAFQEARFVGMQFVKFTEKAWFVHDGVELREVKLTGWKPERTESSATRSVLYKGPFAQAIVAGHSFARGQRVAVPVAVWQQLRLGPGAEQFLFFESSEREACG